MKDNNRDLFELMLASNDSDEQFPVLKAFQSYLEAEREKSRRRQSQITICFLISTIVLVVCFCVVGFAFFSKFIEKDNQLTQLLLLERTGAKQLQSEVVNHQIQDSKVVTEQSSNEEMLSKLVAELQSEIASLKADLEEKELQSSSGVGTQHQPIKEVKDSDNQPVDNPPQEASDGKSDVNLEQPTVSVATTSTTTTTTSTTSTTTTQPVGPKVVELNLSQGRVEKSVVPEGHTTEILGVVTDNNVFVPWHVLLPTPE